MPRSTFYYYVKRAGRPDKYEKIKEEILNIYQENQGRYGYRRITMELHNRGFSVNHKTVQRLMKKLGLKCVIKIKRYHSYRGEVGKVAQNLIQRDFQADCPDQKWTTDVTQFEIAGTKLYLSPVLDMFNGEVISYTLSEHPTLSLVMEMLDKAFQKVPDTRGLILHSDQGWQYQHEQYQKVLKDHGILQSMSRKGNCLDNAIMESFFGLFKSELLYTKEFQSVEEFKTDLEVYIDYYNNKRIKEKLKGLSPVEYRNQFFAAA